MASYQSIITKNAQETATLGETMGTSLKDKRGERHEATVLCLYGNLGSGKTTFTQGFARGLGITSRLLSPTFIIVRRYGIPHTSGFLYHIDLYRMNGLNEMEDLGIAEILQDRHSYVVIEWAEKLESVKPRNSTDISFTPEKDGTHRIEVAPYI